MAAKKPLNQFRVMSFDCYGTLIDWEAGILAALESTLNLVRQSVSSDEVLRQFAERETRVIEHHPDKLYADILAETHRQLAALWQIDVSDATHAAFAASIVNWPAFADAAPAITYLAEHHAVVILSNVDNRSFEGSRKQLGVEFAAVYTAEDIGSYKPAQRNFDYLIDAVAHDFECGQDEILHVAQSLFHDHEPAKEKGLTTAWIDRHNNQASWGATLKPANLPNFDYRFTDLAEFANAHRAAAVRSGVVP